VIGKKHFSGVLKSKEIEPVALVIIELCFFEGIS